MLLINITQNTGTEKRNKMNRSAKGFRVLSGIFLLMNLVAFFLPVTRRIQENYATVNWSQMDYVKCMFQRCLPHGKESIVYSISTGQIIWILLLMVLPIIIVLVAGIWGIVGNSKQIVSGILSFVVLGMYVGMILSLQILWPETVSGQFYSRGMGCMILLVASGCSVISAVIAWIVTPRRVKAVQGGIPQVEEIKQQQIQAKYNIITDESIQEQKETETVAYTPGSPRGVMVGLAGMYAGAEIPFVDGEYIKLGRLPDNDLVFEGQTKVSRNHCRIKWIAGQSKYVFCDYSSNGSFVDGSEDCLPQNLEIEMEPGTVVAIGDETNKFRLE